MYRISDDPACMHDLALDPEYNGIKENLEAQMMKELKAQGDPRMFGNGHVFDDYPYSGAVQGFYERYMAGEKIKTGWVNPSDFEKEPIE